MVIILKNEEINTESIETKEEAKKKYRGLLLFLFLLLLLCLTRCIGEIRDDKATPIRGTLNLEINSNSSKWNNEEIQAAVNKAVDEGYFDATMNTSINLREKDQQANLFIYNNPDNKYSTYIDIKTASGEKIYSSQIIEPGFKVEYDYLDQELASGSHKCIATFNILKDGKLINKMDVQVSIEVK